MDPQNGKSSREGETASLCSRYNTDPPIARLEADRRSKSKQSPGNSSEIDAISREVINATSCHSSCHRYAAL